MYIAQDSVHPHANKNKLYAGDLEPLLSTEATMSNIQVSN